MFRVFTSESPLLGAVNIEQFTSPAFDGLRVDDGKTTLAAAALLIASMDLSSKDNYLDWVYCWKQMVAELSMLSHNLKRPKNYTHTYEMIRRRTLPVLSADYNIKMSEHDILEEYWEARRDQFLEKIQTALTLLYSARITGKLATSHIHLNSRLERAGKTCGEMLAKSILNRYAA